MSFTTFLSMRERVDIFLQRLELAPPVSSPEEAIALMRAILEAVEDEFSGVVRNPDPSWTLSKDGRMYPPKKEYIHPDGHDGAKIAETSGHLIKLGADGSIIILHKNSDGIVDRTELMKPGAI